MVPRLLRHDSLAAQHLIILDCLVGKTPIRLNGKLEPNSVDAVGGICVEPGTSGNPTSTIWVVAGCLAAVVGVEAAGFSDVAVPEAISAVNSVGLVDVDPCDTDGVFAVGVA